MAQSAKKRILVIDDLAELRQLARSVLEETGFAVDVAPDATLGALKLLSEKPDLMIMDPVMPGVDGFKLLEYVRQVTATPPVVFLNASDNLESALRGVRLGAFAFLPKPVNFTTLVETCHAALNRTSVGKRRDEMAERRAHLRRAFHVPVRLARDGAPEAAGRDVSDTPKGFVRGEMTDLSAGGARVVSVARLPVGVRVQLMPDPTAIHASPDFTAEIRMSQVVDTGFRHGLQFVDLDPELQLLLKQQLMPR